MRAVQFPQVNRNWAESQEEYNTLPACVYDKVGDTAVPETSVQCFELSDADIATIVVHKKIWHRALTFGGPLQPFNLFAVKDYFEAEEPEVFPTKEEIAEVKPEQELYDITVEISFWQALKLVFGGKLVGIFKVKTRGFQLEKPEFSMERTFVWTKVEG